MTSAIFGANTVFVPKTCYAPLSMYYIDITRVYVLAHNPAEAAHHWTQWRYEQRAYDVKVYGAEPAPVSIHQGLDANADALQFAVPVAAITLITGDVFYMYKTPIKNEEHYGLPAGVIFCGGVEPRPICLERFSDIIRAVGDDTADPVTLFERIGEDIKAMTAQHFSIIVGLLKNRRNVDRFRLVGLFYEKMEPAQYREFIESTICPTNYFYGQCEIDMLLDGGCKACMHCFRYDGSGLDDWE